MENNNEMPTSEQLEGELKRIKYLGRYRSLLRSTIFVLITVAAVAVLVATLLLPVLQIYGSSMTPSLSEGDIVVSVKGFDFDRGDIVSFYYNNKILVKRVIAFQGEWVNIDKDGNVYINNVPLDEPYLVERAVGECDIELPYQVPDGKIFVMGDHRSTSVDSRSTTVGCVAEEQIVGRIVFRVWPVGKLGVTR
jgi:signal peptidase I